MRLYILYKISYGLEWRGVAPLSRGRQKPIHGPDYMRVYNMYVHNGVFYFILFLFFPFSAVTPAGFRFSPMLAVIAVGCVASVVSVVCIVAVAVAVHRKRGRRRRRDRSNDESKTAIDGSGGTGTGTGGSGGSSGGGVDGGDGGGAADVSGTGGGMTGCNGGGGGMDRHHHRTEAIDDGLEKNPDIIPHDNGKCPTTISYCVSRNYFSSSPHPYNHVILYNTNSAVPTMLSVQRIPHNVHTLPRAQSTPAFDNTIKWYTI